jgi:hypothetical protein
MGLTRCMRKVGKRVDVLTVRCGRLCSWMWCWQRLPGKGEGDDDTDREISRLPGGRTNDEISTSIEVRVWCESRESKIAELSTTTNESRWTLSPDTPTDQLSSSCSTLCTV